MTSTLRHQYPYDTHHGGVINRAEFDVCTSSSFKGVKLDTQIDRIALYSIDVGQSNLYNGFFEIDSTN